MCLCLSAKQLPTLQKLSIKAAALRARASAPRSHCARVTKPPRSAHRQEAAGPLPLFCAGAPPPPTPPPTAGFMRLIMKTQTSRARAGAGPCRPCPARNRKPTATPGRVCARAHLCTLRELEGRAGQDVHRRVAQISRHARYSGDCIGLPPHHHPHLPTHPPTHAPHHPPTYIPTHPRSPPPTRPASRARLAFGIAGGGPLSRASRRLRCERVAVRPPQLL